MNSELQFQVLLRQEEAATMDRPSRRTSSVGARNATPLRSKKRRDGKEPNLKPNQSSMRRRSSSNSSSRSSSSSSSNSSSRTTLKMGNCRLMNRWRNRKLAASLVR